MENACCTDDAISPIEILPQNTTSRLNVQASTKIVLHREVDQILNDDL